MSIFLSYIYLLFYWCTTESTFNTAFKQLTSELLEATTQLATIKAAETPLHPHIWDILDNQLGRAPAALFHMMFLGIVKSIHRIFLEKGLAKLSLWKKFDAIMIQVTNQYIYGTTRGAHSQLFEQFRVRKWPSRNNWNGSDWMKWSLALPALVVPVLDFLKRDHGNVTYQGHLEKLRVLVLTLHRVCSIVMSHQITAEVIFCMERESWSLVQQMAQLEIDLKLNPLKKNNRTKRNISLPGMKKEQFVIRLQRHKLGLKFKNNTLRKDCLILFYLSNPGKQDQDDHLQRQAEAPQNEVDDNDGGMGIGGAADDDGDNGTMDTESKANDVGPANDLAACLTTLALVEEVSY